MTINNNIGQVYFMTADFLHCSYMYIMNIDRFQLTYLSVSFWSILNLYRVLAAFFHYPGTSRNLSSILVFCKSATYMYGTCKSEEFYFIFR